LVSAGVFRDAARQLVRLAFQAKDGRRDIAHSKKAQCLDSLSEVASCFYLEESDHRLVTLT
jgi:hypothetical protein